MDSLACGCFGEKRSKRTRSSRSLLMRALSFTSSPCHPAAFRTIAELDV